MATYLDRVWNQHRITALGDGTDLLHVDRHILQDMGSPQAFAALEREGRRVRHPALTFAVPDHLVATGAGRSDETVPGGADMIRFMRGHAARHGIRMFDLGQVEQGISHMVSAEQGIALPGLLLVSPDLHTSTAGALGTIAWGIGASESEHVLATQTIIKAKPKTMRVKFEGTLPLGVSAKDMILTMIATISTRGGLGYAIEYSGAAVRALDIAGRATLCNMTVEAGAQIGYVLPDEITFDYISGRPYAPSGEHWDRALSSWRAMAKDADGPFDSETTIDVATIAPQITWGTTPQQVIAIGGRVPEPANSSESRALSYMGLTAGQTLEGLPIDKVFIGSCTNGRLADLRLASEIVRHRKVAPGLRAIVVPGSGLVKQAAEEEGLHRVFLDAGFEWREPGCSMCAGLNPDMIEPGERCVSTANRNVEGRPGPNARVHLASPAMAAAAAIAGYITDVRKLRRI